MSSVRPFAPRALALLSLAAAVAGCGGSDKASGPSTDNQQVVNRLTQLSARLGDSPAGAFVGFASMGLSLGVQPSAIDVTTDLARRGPVAEGVSLATSAAKSMQGVAFRLVVQNAPEAEGDVALNGGVMWTPDLNQFVVIIGSDGTGTFDDYQDGDFAPEDFAIGALLTVNPQATWLATGGSMTLTGGPTGSGGTACPGNTSGVTCRLGTFTFGYDITSSIRLELPGDAATGSRTATLAPRSVNGYTITMDWNDIEASGRRAAYDSLLRMAR